MASIDYTNRYIKTSGLLSTLPIFYMSQGIIKLYCLAAQVGFYSDVFDFIALGPGFDPRQGHEVL